MCSCTCSYGAGERVFTIVPNDVFNIYIYKFYVNRRSRER